MDNQLTPEFLFVEDDPTTDDIRLFLSELADVGTSEVTKMLFVELSVLNPAERLYRNVSTVAGILSQHHVVNVLDEGVLLDERNALIELDVLGFTVKSRIVARALLNVKERWIMVKTTSGIFRSAREAEGGFISLDS